MSRPEDQYPNDQRKYPNELEVELYRLAPSRVTVLLVGGSQPLNRAIAFALHERSPRAAHPFVTFDCRGRDSDTVELTLFGGPVYASVEPGVIRQAGAGTLYVAAIDELPLLVQPRFLRFLDQERKVRVIASADEDLLTRVEQGHFRLDLAERLTLVELVLPAARDSV